jgi:catechol 2,3-dioxygenase-like lactoylglutathione lyase family enzyme
MTTQQPPSPTASIEATGLHIKRPCLAVADLDRALEIYRDILGFRLDYVSEASANSYLYMVFDFPRQAQLKFAALSTQYETRALALTEVKGMELPAPTLPYRAATVIRVPEVAPIMQKLQALELKIVEPSSFTAPPNLVFTEQAFFDYDHHLIVLYDVKSA